MRTSWLNLGTSTAVAIKEHPAPTTAECLRTSRVGMPNPLKVEESLKIGEIVTTVWDETEPGEPSQPAPMNAKRISCFHRSAQYRTLFVFSTLELFYRTSWAFFLPGRLPAAVCAGGLRW